MQTPHPLALRLRERAPAGSALLVGIGNGRNLPPLCSHFSRVAAIVPLRAFPYPDASFDALLATHALQHGRLAEVTTLLGECARVLRDGAVVGAALASTRDARFGRGRAIEPNCYVDDAGDEPGVAHLFVDRETLERLFAPWFTIESATEQDADATVGAWAHATPRGFVHWFVEARRRDSRR